MRGSLAQLTTTAALAAGLTLGLTDARLALTAPSPLIATARAVKVS